MSYLAKSNTAPLEPFVILSDAKNLGFIATREVNHRGKRDANKDRNNKLLHPFGALTVGKRPFLISRFRFLPSVDIR